MPITLTERHTLKFLDGIQIKGDDGFMISALPGKWHPFEEGNFFTVRLTGVERESHPTDIPPYVTENLLPSPERFSDKLIKKTNRHAVLVIARNVSAPAYIPRELMAVQDDSMNLGSSCIDGIVEMLICDSKPISPTTPYLWYISTRPIVLIDYKFPLVADERNERVWNKKIGEDYPRMNINYTDSDPDLVIYDHGLYKPKRQRFTAEQINGTLNDNFERENGYSAIAYTNTSDSNEAFIDYERRVVPDGLLIYSSGPYSHSTSWDDKKIRLYY